MLLDCVVIQNEFRRFAGSLLEHAAEFLRTALREIVGNDPNCRLKSIKQCNRKTFAESNRLGIYGGRLRRGPADVLSSSSPPQPSIPPAGSLPLDSSYQAFQASFLKGRGKYNISPVLLRDVRGHCIKTIEYE